MVKSVQERTGDGDGDGEGRRRRRKEGEGGGDGGEGGGEGGEGEGEGEGGGEGGEGEGGGEGGGGGGWRREEKEKEKEEEEEEKEGRRRRRRRWRRRRVEEEEAATEEEKVKVKERKGHGIRHDTTARATSKGGVGEIKVVGNESRYISKSREKMELAYLHSIVYLLYDGYVSKILMAELTGLEGNSDEAVEGGVEGSPVLADWECGTVIWARGAFLPKTRWLMPCAKGRRRRCWSAQSETTAAEFKKVMTAVLEAAISRQQPLGEVAHNVAPALESTRSGQSLSGVGC
ncbi:unnamed protein product [Closterium sp. NIES-65]|nr:unnamed protein product [Closterium sp. NIES-65]